jgi:hypothetical protein
MKIQEGKVRRVRRAKGSSTASNHNTTEEDNKDLIREQSKEFTVKQTPLEDVGIFMDIESCK